MAFKSANLSVLAYANGFTFWHYKSVDDVDADMMTIGYFDAAADLLRPGDMLALNGAGNSAALVRVSSNHEGRVTAGFTIDWQTQAAVAAAAGGATVDAQARAAVNAVISALERVGVLAT